MYCLLGLTGPWPRGPDAGLVQLCRQGAEAERSVAYTVKFARLWKSHS